MYQYFDPTHSQDKKAIRSLLLIKNSFAPGKWNAFQIPGNLNLKLEGLHTYHNPNHHLLLLYLSTFNFIPTYSCPYIVLGASSRSPYCKIHINKSGKFCLIFEFCRKYFYSHQSNPVHMFFLRLVLLLSAPLSTPKMIITLWFAIQYDRFVKKIWIPIYTLSTTR